MRQNKGQGVTCLVPDLGGKLYHDQRKVHKQFLQRQQLQRTKHHVLLTMLMRKINKKKDVQFFQIAVNSIFLSAQMSARKGIKHFGE